ncbi:MAG: metallophosphoesterase [Chlorobiales bacterium]|nr:metallophosphoesterase [Chlorobiales bacterium]
MTISYRATLTHYASKNFFMTLLNNKYSMSRRYLVKSTSMLIVLFALLNGASSASAEPWKFGVMGDSQWTTADPDNANPNTVPVAIINQVNQEFIKAGVKFVIAVGDLSDDGNDISEVTRAQAAQPLIDAGIGFFPFRGNHETVGLNKSYGLSVFHSNYPQTRTGTFTKTNLQYYKVGNNFSSPVSVSTELNGMSYSFDYGDPESRARFVIVDTWAMPGKVDKNPNGYAYGYTVNDQQAWISSRLDKKSRKTGQAFVFSHQPLMAEGHQDTMFNGYTHSHPDWQNRFFASMQDNGVKLYISGHDHIHQRSIISSPDGKSHIQEIICASNSSKFYNPKPLDDPKWFGQKSRETSISQERYTVGYYIYTVDGPCVTVDYYSDDHGNWMSDANYPNGAGKADTGITPSFHFVKKETWSYSTNGKEFLIPQGTSYAKVSDSFKGTIARILDGTNNSTEKDCSLDTKGGVGRKLTKTVDTGWYKKQSPSQSKRGEYLASNILCLTGMGDLGRKQTDVYTLSISYDRDKVHLQHFNDGLFGLATKDTDGNWINAVDKNSGGARTFVAGPWKKGYTLGTYGIDKRSKTVWAVINYNDNFAAARFSK